MLVKETDMLGIMYGLDVGDRLVLGLGFGQDGICDTLHHKREPRRIWAGSGGCEIANLGHPDWHVDFAWVLTSTADKTEYSLFKL